MTEQPSGPPPPITPERARHIARAYKALAENIADLVPGEAIIAERQAEWWSAYADSLATKPPLPAVTDAETIYVWRSIRELGRCALCTNRHHPKLRTRNWDFVGDAVQPKACRVTTRRHPSC